MRVHSRFAGEIVSLGATKENGAERQLRYGDRVEKGELLAVVWSKEIGEEKSELIDALSRLDLSQALLKRLESLQAGVVADRVIVEARRNLEADLIAVSRAERTLRSWRVDDEEIASIRKEVDNIRDKKGNHDPRHDRKWAEIEVRAPMSGVIIEKNYNVGDMIEPNDDLIKVADLSRLQVLANIYEEDLWEIRALPAAARKWSLDLKSDPTDNKIEGSFDLIGSVIDPTARTGVLLGWVDNPDGKFSVGQFITATIQLPSATAEVVVPGKAVIEEGDRSMVFVQDRQDPLTFYRRQVAISRRSAGMIFLHAKPAAGTSGGERESVEPGEKVVVTSALGLGGELEKLQSLAPAP